MSTWNLKALKDCIKIQGGDNALLDIVNSIGGVSEIFIYHLATARDAFDRIVDDKSGSNNLHFVFEVASNQSDFYHARIVNEANIIGCIQAARNIFDIFSSLVNSLILGSSIPIRQCNIAKVRDALQPSELKDTLVELTDSHWFKFISAFINITKHRRLVPNKFTVFCQDNTSTVMFDAFSYEELSFPAYSSEEILDGALEIKNKIIACGNALNRTYGATKCNSHKV